MSTYFVAYGTVKDAHKLATYVELSGPIVASFGGEFLAGSNATTVLLGRHDHHRCAIFKFPTAAACKAWYESPAYRVLWPLRLEAADFVFFMFDAA